MKDINLDTIKEKTYTKIGCNNFIKEDIKRTKTKKILINTMITIIFLSAGLFTVNAATNNGLANIIKKIIKLNGEDYEVIIYDALSKEWYNECRDEQLVSTPQTCIRIPKDKNNLSIYDEFCYPKGTEFENIELEYNDKNHITSYHFSGYDEKEKYFEHKWNIKDDLKVEQNDN